MGHKFKSNRHTYIAEVGRHCTATARLPVGRQMLAGQTSHPHQLSPSGQTGTDAVLQQNDWPLAPCCLVPVGRGDNALSVSDSDSDSRGLSKQSVITDMRVHLAEVGLMERVKICFTVIRQHQDRCLSAWHSRLIGMEDRTKGASHETTVDW